MKAGKSRRQHRGGNADAGADGGADAIGPGLKINLYEIISSLVGGSVTITMYIVFLAVCAILIIAFINMVIISHAAVTDPKNHENVIYKDILKYRLLRYVDIYLEKDKNMKEPIFYIELAAFFLSVIVMCYMFLIIIAVLSVILYFVFMLYIKPMYPNISFDEASKLDINKYMGFGIFAGLIYAIILLSVHGFYFRSKIINEMLSLKDTINKIDISIKYNLTKDVKTFHSDLLKMLQNKSQSPMKNADPKSPDYNSYKKEYANYDKLIDADIDANRYDHAKQKILMITLYSHLYNNIPSTNQKALELINYYFFKNPYSDLEINEYEISDLSFISLMPVNNDMNISYPIIKIYSNFKFYASKDSNEDVATMIRQIDEVIDDINNKLLSFQGFKEFQWDFLAYILVFLFLSIILTFIYCFVLQSSPLDRSLTNMAGNVTKLMMVVIPPLEDITAQIADNQAYQKCALETDVITRRMCMSSIVKQSYK
jgi:hypothetical protein